MRKKLQKNRVESSCLLTDVNKASHKLSAKRAERHQQQTEAATSCNWQLASCGNSVWHATFCCCLDICNGAHKKIYIAFRRMRQGSAQTSSSMVMMLMRRLGTSEELRRGQAVRFGGSATINVTICDLCLAPAWLTLWYLEFLWAHPVLRSVRSGDQRWQPSPSVDADDDCI